jgi:hypothetical protein
MMLSIADAPLPVSLPFPHPRWIYCFRTIPEVLDPNEEMWGIYEFKKGFGGYSDLVLQTQDYIFDQTCHKIAVSGV